MVNVDQLRIRQAVRPQHAVHQCLQAIGFTDDDTRVFFQRCVGDLALQQLRRTAQATERVLDLVRQSTHQRMGCLLLVYQQFVLFNAQLMVDLAHLELHERPKLAVDKGREGAVDAQVEVHPVIPAGNLASEITCCRVIASAS